MNVPVGFTFVQMKEKNVKTILVHLAASAERDTSTREDAVSVRKCNITIINFI